MKKKVQGKKGFLHYFWRRLLITLIVGVLAVAWISYDQWKQTRDTRPSNAYIESEITNLESSLTKYHNKDLSISDCLSSYCKSTNYSESALLLYQPETGEFYASRPMATAFVRQNGESHLYRTNDADILNRLAASENFYYYDSEPIIYSIYVKDDQFIPGEVYMEKSIPLSDMKEKKEGEKYPGEWIDLSPENTDGWTKICSRYTKEYLCAFHGYAWDENEDEPEDGEAYLKNVFISSTAFFRQTALAMDQLVQDIPKQYKQYQDAFSRYKLEDHSRKEIADREAMLKNELEYLPMALWDNYVYNMWINFDANKRINGSTDFSWFSRDNFAVHYYDIHFHRKTWKLFSFAYQDPVKSYQYQYVQFLPLIAVCYILPAVLVIGLLWAVIAYLIHSKKYDIKAYRKNLTGALAHDLKTPLTVIYGNAENLRNHTYPEKADDYADCIMENVMHMDEMIAATLELSQLSSQKKPEMKDQVDLTALLHQAFQRNASLMEQRGLTLKESGSMTVSGNTKMLTQLADNLVSNAVRHTAEGGSITVDAEKHTLRISNPYTGELDVKTICEPFRRGDSARGSHSGSGLGLSIVQQIASLNKLRLRITAKDGIYTVELKSSILWRDIF